MPGEEGLNIKSCEIRWINVGFIYNSLPFRNGWRDGSCRSKLDDFLPA